MEACSCSLVSRCTEGSGQGVEVGVAMAMQTLNEVVRGGDDYGHSIRVVNVAISR